MGIAEAKWRRFLYRTGAAFVSTRLGIRSKAPITAAELNLPSPRKTGGLIIAGSYVPKTTAQLKALIDRRGGELSVIEIKVEDLISTPEDAKSVVEQAIRQIESHLQSGQDTLVMTSRKLVTGEDELSSLAIGSKVAGVLVDILQSIQVRPRYIIAKASIRPVFYLPKTDKAGRNYILRRSNKRPEHQTSPNSRPSRPGRTALALRPANIETYRRTLCGIPR